MPTDSWGLNSVSGKYLALLALGAGFASCTTFDRTVEPNPPAAAPPSDADRDPDPQPRLVVLLVVDQLPAWSFNDIEPHLTGGLARLLREGVEVTGRYPYAATLTAPGHATLGTGVAPSESGIFVNKRFDRSQGKIISSVQDTTFFSALDARVGEDNWAVVLTADHGAAPRVERSAKHSASATNGRS